VVVLRFGHIPTVGRELRLQLHYTKSRLNSHWHNDGERQDMTAKKKSSASRKVERAMHERKRGTLHSGRSGKIVRSRKQAIAIGLSEARRAGAMVPKKKSSRKK
jgi:hypothetical protein